MKYKIFILTLAFGLIFGTISVFGATLTPDDVSNQIVDYYNAHNSLNGLAINCGTSSTNFVVKVNITVVSGYDKAVYVNAPNTTTVVVTTPSVMYGLPNGSQLGLNYTPTGINFVPGSDGYIRISSFYFKNSSGAQISNFQAITPSVVIVKKGTITIKYVCDGTSISDDTVVNDVLVGTYSENSKSIDGYAVSGDSSQSVTLTNDNLNPVITFTYTKVVPPPPFTPPQSSGDLLKDVSSIISDLWQACIKNGVIIVLACIAIGVLFLGAIFLWRIFRNWISRKV